MQKIRHIAILLGIISIYPGHRYIKEISSLFLYCWETGTSLIREKIVFIHLFILESFILRRLERGTKPIITPNEGKTVSAGFEPAYDDPNVLVSTIMLRAPTKLLNFLLF